MKQRRALLPILGFLFWTGLILLFNRHDLAFYAVSFLLSLTLSLLAHTHMAPRQTSEVEVKIYND